MVMNRETLLKAYPDLPQAVQNRMEQTLLRLKCESANQRQPMPKHRLTLILALVLALAAVGGLAAGLRFGVFDLMQSLFGQADVLPQAQSLLADDLATVELPHSALAVEQAVYDGGNLRLVYSIRSTAEGLSIQEAAEQDHVSLNGCDWFTLNGQTISMTNGSAFGSLLAPEGDRLLCYLDLYLASSGILPQGDLSVGLPLIDGQMVSFTVPGYQASAISAAAETDAVRATLLSASLSPVRAYARLRIERQADASAEAYAAALDDWRDAYLVDADGTILSAPGEILTDAMGEGQWVELTYIFLPTETEQAFFAPTLITPQNQWMVDMAHALPMQ